MEGKEKQGVVWIMKMVKEETTDASCVLEGSECVLGKVSSRIREL